MKKTLLFLTAILSTLSLLAGEPFFCTRPGTKLHYERYKVKTAKLIQTTLFEIESRHNSAQGLEVQYAITMDKANGSHLFGGRAVQEVTVAPNGDVKMNFGLTVKHFVQNAFPHARVTNTESLALLPADMQPGDTLPETRCKVKAMGIPVHFNMTERVVLRRERITTPAGTFDCLVVREHKKEDAPFHHRDNWVDDYYAPGYGYVRHDVLDKNMQLLESEVLVRIEEPAASDGRP